MRLCRTVLLASFIFAIATAGHSFTESTDAAGPYVSGEIIVKFRPGVVSAARAAAHSQAGGAVRAEIGRTGVQLINVPAGMENAAIAAYKRNPNVLHAEPNFLRSIPEPLTAASTSEVLPQDRYFDEQWALNNTGQSFYCIAWFGGEFCLYSGTADADIDAPEAWALSTGNAAIKVAVVDSGVDYTHPDLAGRYLGGYDFIFNDNDPADDQGHGTHVAGTIAASMANPTGDPPVDEGVAGVAPSVSLLAYKVCRADGTCSDFAIQQAIARAVTDGAKVINMSFGGPDYSQTLDEAVQDAWAAGAVLVAGAGNDSSTNLFYPAALDHVISVAAFDEDARRASFSNYGSWVDIAAPGNAIISTYPMSACGGAGATPGEQGCYNFLSGTSMATPHVSGAAALVWSRADVTTNAQVVEILLQTAEGQGVSPVRLDSWTIHGGLNIHDALTFGAPPPPPPNGLPVANAGVDQALLDSDFSGAESVTLNGSASSDLDGSIVSYVWTEGATVLASGVSPTISLAVGSHAITLTVTDDDGGTDTDGVSITVNANNHAPVANAGPDQSLMDSSGDGTESVTLNGSASSDSDGSIASYIWTEGVTVLATGSSPTISLAVGSHTITLKVTDDDGASNTDNVVIVITALPPPVGDPVMYFSVVNDGNVGVSSPKFVRNEDIIAWYGGDNFALLFDGSDVGLAGFTIDAFDVIASNKVLLSFTSQGMVAGIDTDDSDVLLFTGTFGPTTSGSFSMYFDASDVGLTAAGENVDVVRLLPNGHLLISTSGNYGVFRSDASSLAGTDADVIEFIPLPTQPLGDDSTAGSWVMYFDGSDVALDGGATEDVDALALDSSGKLYLSTTGNFVVAGAAGANEDVFIFTPTSLGEVTAGSYSSSLFFDGSLYGLDANDLSAVDVVAAAVNEPPVANAGPDQSVTDGNGNGSEGVTLNGSASSDADGSIVSYVWTEGATALANGPSPTISLAVGSHTITLKVTDDDGAITADTVLITVNALPPPVADPVMYLSLLNDGNVGVSSPLAVANEDIVAWYGGDSFGVYFDGSDVGLAGFTIDAFDVIASNKVLLSFTSQGIVAGIDTDDSDVLLFTGTLGPTTSGSFSMYFDASDVGLTTAGENVDVVHLLPNGHLLISTSGNYGVWRADSSSLAGTDADIIEFIPLPSEPLGDASTAGSFVMYFDGSDVGLDGGNNEDVDALALDSSGKIYLSTTGDFGVTGATGANEDIFAFTPSSLGEVTTGSYNSALYFDGSLYGLAANDLSSIDLP